MKKSKAQRKRSKALGNRGRERPGDSGGVDGAASETANGLLLKERPPQEQLKRGEFNQQFLMHSESNTRARVYRRENCVLDRWIAEGGVGYDPGAQRAIADCIILWRKMGNPRLIASYGERISAFKRPDDGQQGDDAASEIAFRKKMVPANYWDVFENVVRHNESAGVAGANYAKNPAQQIASAKAIVGMVASVMAMKLGYREK